MRRVVALARIFLGLGWAYVNLAMCLGLILLMLQSTSGSTEATLSISLMTWLVGWPVVLLALPVRMLALGDPRRLMPGHAQAAALLIAGIASLFTGLGIAVSCWRGLDPAAASMVACGTSAVSVWVCVAIGSLRLSDLVIVGGLAALLSLDGPLVWLSVTPWRSLTATAASLVLLAWAIWRIGWVSKGPSPLAASRPAAVDAGWDQVQLPWLDRSGRDCPDAWRGCRRRILQPWDPGRLLLAGFALVLLLYVVGSIFDAVGSDRPGRQNLGRDFIVIGTLLAGAGAAIAILLVAGRAQRIQRQLLLAPGTDRRGVGVRLVDAQIMSSLEMTLALTGGAALASLLLDHHWIGILRQWRIGDEVMQAYAAGAVGTCAIVAGLMLAWAVTAPPLIAWLLSWAMPWWVRWLQAVLGLAIIFGWGFVTMPCLNAWRQHGDAWPAILAVVLILTVGVVGRFLAIRRLAVAEPD